jgi:two-component system LytT family response regulator
MKIRVLIVDDEPWARKRIATLLKPEQDIEIIGECSTGDEAIVKILELTPDLVFLDIQMPDVDGFQVVDTISAEHMPVVIFATAYDKYALRAFDAHALDYLLKPFDEERFHKALNRARKDLQSGKGSAETAVRLILRSLRSHSKYLCRFAVKAGGCVTFIRAAEIDWLEASGNYVMLHLGRDSHLVRTTMNALEPRLNSEQFVRIHRSTIVNLDRVKELRPWFRGEQRLMLKDGTELTIGRGFRDRLNRLLENVL